MTNLNFCRETELVELTDPTPIRMDDGRWYLQHSLNPQYGWYYTSYNPDTREGAGWFGSADEPQYYFENALVPEFLVREDGSEELVLASRNCGIGEGCFWTDWQ